MVDEVGKGITIYRQQWSLCSTTVNVLHITTLHKQLRLTDLINFEFYQFSKPSATLLNRLSGMWKLEHDFLLD